LKWFDSVDDLYRLTCFIVFLVSFTLYGIEGIAEEIGQISLARLIQMIHLEKVRMVTLAVGLINSDIKMDVLIEDLKEDLRFVIERIAAD